MRSMEARQWKMTAIIKADDPLTTTQEVAEELNVDHSTVIRHLKQIGKVRKLDKWVPHELITIRKVTVLVGRWTLYHWDTKQTLKIIVLKCRLLLCWAATNRFSLGLWRATKRIYVTTGNDQPSSCTEKKTQSFFKVTPKDKLVPRKRYWSLFGGLLSVWSTIASWILVKTLHQRSTLSKQMRCAENYNACSWHWSTERAQCFSMTMPNHTSYNQHVIQPTLQKLNELGYEVLPHLRYPPDLSTMDYHQASWQLFEGKMLPQPAGGRNAFQEFIESWSMDFYATKINRLISHWQKCVDFNGL